jgi:hypothetical protein
VSAELCTTTVHVEDHLARLQAWFQDMGPAVPYKEVFDVVVCLEDTLTTLLCTFLAAPQLCQALMNDSGHRFTSTLAFLHDVLLMDVVYNKIKAPDYSHLKERVDAASMACVGLSCHLLLEGLLKSKVNTGPSTSKAATTDVQQLGDALLSTVGEMQAWYPIRISSGYDSLSAC